MEAIGPVLLLVSIPLMLRWVPRNRVFGLRIPATLRDDSIWYDANALCARHLFVLGLVMVALEFVLPLSWRIPVLRVVATVGFFGIMVADWRTANRWARQRSGHGPSGGAELQHSVGRSHVVAKEGRSA